MMTRSQGRLRRLDALVAGAMGWTLHVTGYPVAFWLGADGIATGYCDQPWPADTERYGDAPGLFSPKGVWAPSTNWAAAGCVVEWIVAQGKFFFELYNDALGYSLDLIPIRLEDEADFVCGDRATNGPLAICLAFLRARGVEVPSE